MSHGFGVSGADIGRIFLGGMPADVSDKLGNDRRWMSGTVDLRLGSKPKGSGGLGGFFGGRTPLGSDPGRQFFIGASSRQMRHFFIKARNEAFLSEGNLSFVTWLALRAQLS